MRLTEKSGGLLYFILINASNCTDLADSMVTLWSPRGDLVSRDGNFVCRSGSAKCHQKAAVGNWISFYVKCCRMVDCILFMYTISLSCNLHSKTVNVGEMILSA